MVLDVAVAVLGDVCPDEPHLVVADHRERALQVRLPVAQRLHLGAGQREPRLDLVREVVVVPRAAIVDDQLLGHAGSALALASANRSVSHPCSSATKRGSIACGSGYSRYVTSAPASRSSRAASRPNSTEMMGSSDPWPIATGGAVVRFTSNPSTVGMNPLSATMPAGRGRSRPSPRA